MSQRYGTRFQNWTRTQDANVCVQIQAIDLLPASIFAMPSMAGRCVIAINQAANDLEAVHTIAGV